MEKRCKNINCLRTPQKHRLECSTCRLRKWVARNPVTSRFVFWKRNTRKRGIPNEVTIHQYTVFGIETGYFYLLSIGIDVTIDRKISTEPYRIGNMQLLTRADNSRKARNEIAYGMRKYVKKQDGDLF